MSRFLVKRSKRMSIGMPERLEMLLKDLEKGEQLGWVMKPSRENASIFISPGSGVSIESSLELTLKFLVDKKLPEPLVLAHEYSNRVRAQVQAETQRDRLREEYLG